MAIAVFLAACTGCGRADLDTAMAARLPSFPVGGQIGPEPGPPGPAAPVKNPYADDPSSRADGWRLFNWYNCSGCHGSHGGGGMGPSLRDSSWIYGGEPDDIFNSIAQGRAKGMPAWGRKISAAQVWQLVSYIKTLQTRYEVQPPPPLPPEPAPLP